MTEETTNFDSVKVRLDEIAEEVAGEGISLDDALELFEEAVKLGLSACDLSEKDILVPEDAPAEDGEAPAEEQDSSQDAHEEDPSA